MLRYARIKISNCAFILARFSTGILSIYYVNPHFHGQCHLMPLNSTSRMDCFVIVSVGQYLFRGSWELLVDANVSIFKH